jgi:putative oxidoreductase
VFAEFFCSLLIIAGFLTRPALFFLIIVMAVAAFIVHANDSLADREHALLYLFVYLAVFITGPGKFSMDNKIFKFY